jgi:hypothetical protein
LHPIVGDAKEPGVIRPDYVLGPLTLIDRAQF